MRITLKNPILAYDLTGIPLVRNLVLAAGTYTVECRGPLVAHTKDQWLAFNNQPIGLLEEDLNKLDGQVIIEED